MYWWHELPSFAIIMSLAVAGMGNHGIAKSQSVTTD